MSDDDDGKQSTDQLYAKARARSEQALQMVAVNLPWLSPLVYTVRIVVDDRCHVAAVTQSGFVLVNSVVFAKIPLREATYVMAHELLHLALDTFSRESTFDDPETVNIAHDYIINDLLRVELNMKPPLGGLFLENASQWSLEQLVAWMKDGVLFHEKSCWGQVSTSAMGAALRDAGILPQQAVKAAADPPLPVLGRRRSSVFNPAMDVIFPSQERIILSDQPEHKRVSSQPVRDAMRQALALKSIAKQVSNFSFPRFNSSVSNTQFVNALRSQYQPPWQAALQRWMEAVAPGQRTYTRPSRRGADRSDCVLPGRSREGWTLHIVLDTSESMSNELPKCLSAIADFCEGVGVSDVHLLQCDSKVTVDEWVTVEELDQYQITGSGGSNMCPAMLKLAADPETTAIVVITDGEILYPHEFSVCEVLWVLTQPDRLSLNEFSPSYGTIVKLG